MEKTDVVINSELSRCNFTVLFFRKLEDQLRETQVAKDELERQQRELHEMMQRLEESKNLEAEERARLEEEIYRKRDEVGIFCFLTKYRLYYLAPAW